MAPQESEGEVVFCAVFNCIVGVAVDVKRADEGAFGVDASGRVAVLVTAVVNHANTKLSRVAAFGLFFFDDTCIHIVLVKCSRLVYIVVHFHRVDGAGGGIEIAQTCTPVEVRLSENRSLHAAHKTQLIAVDEVIAALDFFIQRIRIDEMRLLHYGVVGAGLVAVEAEELVLVGVEISQVEEELGVFEDIGQVAIETEHTRAFGIARGLHVELVVVAGIARAVAEVEDVAAQAVLEA